MGDGRVFLDAGMETIITVGWLVVGGIMQMLLRSWRQSKKETSEQKRTARYTRRVIRRKASSLNA